jgi:hypothetical protein
MPFFTTLLLIIKRAKHLRGGFPFNIGMQIQFFNGFFFCFLNLAFFCFSFPIVIT